MGWRLSLLVARCPPCSMLLLCCCVVLKIIAVACSTTENQLLLSQMDVANGYCRWLSLTCRFPITLLSVSPCFTTENLPFLPICHQLVSHAHTLYTPTTVPYTCKITVSHFTLPVLSTPLDKISLLSVSHTQLLPHLIGFWLIDNPIPLPFF